MWSCILKIIFSIRIKSINDPAPLKQVILIKLVKLLLFKKLFIQESFGSRLSDYCTPLKNNKLYLKRHSENINCFVKEEGKSMPHAIYSLLD